MLKVYTTRQAAEVLGMHPKSLLKLARDGRIKAMREPIRGRNAHLRFSYDAIAQFVADSEVPDRKAEEVVTQISKGRRGKKPPSVIQFV